MKLKSIITAAAASLSLLAVATGAHAQVPTTFSAIPAGSTFIESQSSAFNITANGQTTTGTLLSAVFSSATGGRDFYYQFLVGSGTTAPVTTLSVSDFAGFTTTYFQSSTVDIDGSGAFTTGGDAATGSFTSAGTAFFSYAGVAPGGKSNTILIRTNASNYIRNANGAVIAGASANAPIIAPAGVAVVPEANTVALLGMALPVIGAVVVRRRTKKA